MVDSKKTMNKDNFSVENLINSIDWPDDVEEELKQLLEKVNTHKKSIKIARDRLLAHFDRHTILNTKELLGAFPEGEDEEFLADLKKICNITHKACFGEIAGEIVCRKRGDVEDLKKELGKALVFDRLIKEAGRDEKIKLCQYFLEVSQSNPVPGGGGWGGTVERRYSHSNDFKSRALRIHACQPDVIIMAGD